MTCEWKKRAYNIGAMVTDEAWDTLDQIKAAVGYAWNTTLALCIHVHQQAIIDKHELENVLTVEYATQVWHESVMPAWLDCVGNEVARYACLDAVRDVTEKYIWAVRLNGKRKKPWFMAGRKGHLRLPVNLCHIKDDSLFVDGVGELILTAAPEFELKDIKYITFCWYGNGATDLYFVKKVPDEEA